MSALTIAEMLRSGITCFNDMYFFPEETCHVADKTGIRGKWSYRIYILSKIAVVGGCIIQFPTRYASSPDEYLAKVHNLMNFQHWINSSVEIYLKRGRIIPSSKSLWRLILHTQVNTNLLRSNGTKIFEKSVDDETLLKCKDLAREYSSKIHIHVHETRKEIEDHVAHPSHGGVRPLAR